MRTNPTTVEKFRISCVTFAILLSNKVRRAGFSTQALLKSLEMACSCYESFYMTPEELRSLQTPLKDRYRHDPETAFATIRATGNLDVTNLVCRIDTGRNSVTEAGLHPMAGGKPEFACAAHLLLESLIGCAGVTLSAVATAMNIPVASGTISAEGDLDFRGTLGLSKDVPVGFTEIRLLIALDTTADDTHLTKLGQLAERYCVVAQSLKPKPSVVCRRI